ALRGGTSVSLSDGLRIGARTFATAVQNLNSVVSFVNLSRSTLEDLGGLVDKMLSLADEASKARTSTQKRKALDREFQKLGNDFVDLVENSKLGEREYLTVDGLSELFTLAGLDPEQSRSIAEIFSQFVTPKKDDTLASDDIKGKRPVPVPANAFSGPTADNQYFLKKVTDNNISDGAIATDNNVFSDVDNILNQNPTLESLFVRDQNGSIVSIAADVISSNVKLESVNHSSGYSVISSSEDFLGYNAALVPQLYLVNDAGEIIHQFTSNATAGATFSDVQLTNDSKTAGYIVTTAAGSSAETSVVSANFGDAPAAGTVFQSVAAGVESLSNFRMNDDGSFVAFIYNDGVNNNLRFRSSANTPDTFIEGVTDATDFDFIDYDQLALVRPSLPSGSKVETYRYNDGAYGDVLVTGVNSLSAFSAIEGTGNGSYGDFLKETNSAPVEAFISAGGLSVYDDGANTITFQAADGTTNTLTSASFTVKLLAVDDVNGYSLVMSDDDFLGLNAGNNMQIFLTDSTGTVLHQFTNNTGATFGSVVSADVSEDGKEIVATLRKGASDSVVKITTNIFGGANIQTALRTGSNDQFSSVSISNDGNYAAFVDSSSSAGYFYNASNTVDTFLNGRSDVKYLGFTASGELAVARTAADGTYTVEDYSYNDGAFNNTLLNGINDINLFAATEDVAGFVIDNNQSNDYPGIGQFAYFDATASGGTLSIYQRDGDLVDSTSNFSAGDSITRLSLARDGKNRVDVGAYGAIPSVDGDTDTELYRMQPQVRGYFTYLEDSGGTFDTFYLVNASDSSTVTTQFHNTDVISKVSLAHNNINGVDVGILGQLGYTRNDTDTELYRFEENARYSSGQKFSTVSAEFKSLFSSDSNIRSRANALRVLEDLTALRDQIDKNIKVLDDATSVIESNIELTRAAGFAFLDISKQITGSEDASEVARKVREEIRHNAPAALGQAENLESIAVAALALSDQLPSA
ncbi:MAG: hypothetical protein D6719_11830, partial [Candidatus Dadabacteria bacterium]